MREKSKMMEYIYEQYNVFHGLFTEDLYNTLLKFHNTIINYERFDRVINHISQEKGMKYEEVVKALEDELSENCGFSLHFRIAYDDYYDVFSNYREYSKFIVVEEI